jgi:hypothetical protein
MCRLKSSLLVVQKAEMFLSLKTRRMSHNLSLNFLFLLWLQNDELQQTDAQTLCIPRIHFTT